ncbi:hypothetical protein, partial [Stenotrophomonas indicatrix]
QAQPVAAQASAASGVPGVMSRVTMAVIGTLLLGWVMGWGMPAYRRYSALVDPGIWDGVGLAVQMAMLAIAILLFILFVPMLIMSKRP